MPLLVTLVCGTPTLVSLPSLSLSHSIRLQSPSWIQFMVYLLINDQPICAALRFKNKYSDILMNAISIELLLKGNLAMAHTAIIYSSESKMG